MRYEDYFTANEIETFKRVKLGQMKLAEIAREAAAKLVGADVGDLSTNKHFLTTPNGKFRLAMQRNTDNTTEQWALDELGAQTVVMSDDEEMREFFESHGVHPVLGIRAWRRDVRIRMRKLGREED